MRQRIANAFAISLTIAALLALVIGVAGGLVMWWLG